MGSLIKTVNKIQECELLVNYLAKFNINAYTIYNSKEKEQYTVVIPATNGEFRKFCKLIGSYVSQVPTMQRKLGINF